MIYLFGNELMVGFRFVRPVRCLSSAVLGGGFSRPQTIFNLHVDKNYCSETPEVDLLSAAEREGLLTPAVGLMTSVRMEHAVYTAEDGLHVLATAGTANAMAAGVTPPWQGGPGTINILAYCERAVSDAALAGAAITITEAKVRTLAQAGVRCPVTGEPATGTSTDAFAVACGEGGSPLPYLGPATREGHRLARLVSEAVEGSLRRYTER